MIGVIGYFACLFIGIVIYLQIQSNRRLKRAEGKMAHLMYVSLNRDKLECLWSDLSEVKSKAIKIRFKQMERIYEIEHELNLIAVSLDELERMLIEQGLQQPSERGRVSYMLKLVNLSMATA